MKINLESPIVDSIVTNAIVAVLSAVFTYLITTHLKQSGKIIVNTAEGRFDLYERDNTFTDSLDEATNVDLILRLDIYNSSDVPKSLREIRIEFNVKSRKKRDRYSKYIVYIDGSEKLISKYELQIESIEFINLKPRETERIDVKISVDKIDLVRGENKVYLVAYHPNGKKFIAHLLTETLH